MAARELTVLTILQGFAPSGLAVLEEGSTRPHRLHTTFSEERLERLQDLLHSSSFPSPPIRYTSVRDYRLYEGRLRLPPGERFLNAQGIEKSEAVDI